MSSYIALFAYCIKEKINYVFFLKSSSFLIVYYVNGKLNKIDAFINCFVIMIFFDKPLCQAFPNYFILTHRNLSSTLAKLRARHLFLVACFLFDVLEVMSCGIFRISCIFLALI